MNTRTYGLLWRPESNKGNCQLLVATYPKFMWSHAFKDNTCSSLFKSSVLPGVVKGALNNAGAYWIGPEEMSRWNDNT